MYWSKVESVESDDLYFNYLKTLLLLGGDSKFKNNKSGNVLLNVVILQLCVDDREFMHKLNFEGCFSSSGCILMREAPSNTRQNNLPD